MNKRSSLGLFLIILGITFTLIRADVIGGIFLLPAISLGLLVMYFMAGGARRDANLGYLIPGSMIGAVGLFAVLTEYEILPAEAGSSILLILAGAFLFIMLVHTMHSRTGDWGSRFWPIFPAGVLAAIGTIGVFHQLYTVYIPFDLALAMILVGIGLLLLVHKR